MGKGRERGEGKRRKESWTFKGKWRHCIVHLKVAKRVDLKSSQHRKKIVTMCGGVC